MEGGKPVRSLLQKSRYMMMVAWSKVMEIQVERSVVSGYFEGTPGRLDYRVQKTILRVLA